MNVIPGYTFGTSESAVSPVSDNDLQQLEQTFGWTAEDAYLLNRHADLFHAQRTEMVELWRAVIGTQLHLAHWFVGPDSNPDENYKARVKRRFERWVIDVATRPHDRNWLNYQEEIGLRHTPAKKNGTDTSSTPPLVPLRYLLGFVAVTLPIHQFLEGKIQDQAEMSAIQAAWTKAVLLHVTLWARPYTKDGLW